MTKRCSPWVSLGRTLKYLTDLLGTNVLAYLASSTVMKNTTLTVEVNAIFTLCNLSLMRKQNKLEYLSLAMFSANSTSQIF
jgi:hypothetical protein